MLVSDSGCFPRLIFTDQSTCKKTCEAALVYKHWGERNLVVSSLNLNAVINSWRADVKSVLILKMLVGDFGCFPRLIFTDQSTCKKTCDAALVYKHWGEHNLVVSSLNSNAVINSWRADVKSVLILKMLVSDFGYSPRLIFIDQSICKCIQTNSSHQQ
jgi:hypothetical protein